MSVISTAIKNLDTVSSTVSTDMGELQKANVAAASVSQWNDTIAPQINTQVEAIIAFGKEFVAFDATARTSSGTIPKSVLDGLSSLATQSSALNENIANLVDTVNSFREGVASSAREISTELQQAKQKTASDQVALKEAEQKLHDATDHSAGWYFWHSLIPGYNIYFVIHLKDEINSATKSISQDNATLKSDVSNAMQLATAVKLADSTVFGVQNLANAWSGFNGKLGPLANEMQSKPSPYFFEAEMGSLRNDFDGLA
ncbi:MAG: HBL/NHE enterotoxin family protein [Cyanobacteria bacterium P01_F01_bin.150]